MTLQRLPLLLLLVSAASFGQGLEASNFSVERFRLTPSRTGLLDTEWGAVPRGLTWDAGLWVGWAKNPLVLRRTADGTRVGSLLEDRVGGGVVGALSFLDRYQLGFELPVVLGNGRPSRLEGATLGDLPLVAGPGLGDLRLQAKAGLLREAAHLVDLAVLTAVTLPTSGGSRYLGSSGTVITPEVAVSRAFGNLRAAVNLGAAFRTERPRVLDLSIGHELLARLAVAYRFNQTDASALPLELGVTALGGFSLQRPFQGSNGSPVELKGYAAWDALGWLQVFLGAGVGAAQGWGQPDWRLFGGLRLGTPDARRVAAPPPDADADGVADAEDRCPAEAGPAARQGCPARDEDADRDGLTDATDACPTKAGPPENKGCPDADGDGDSVVDRLDRCPTQPEDKDGVDDGDGCPDPDPDDDGDGVPDRTDACAKVAGVPENRGCPDTDGDGDSVVDRLDNCPAEPGPAANAGCKKAQAVALQAGKLEIREAVAFATNRAVIEPRSFAMLDNVAAVLRAHPELLTVRIEGHTDDQGDDAKNLTLSQARADAVRDYLVNKGIAATRLVAEGFGEARPIADNATDAGRAKNRRVEFNFAVVAAPGDRTEPR
ncbi:MAG: OmpA family protein [Myxococcaceae bacterium]|nr:OmpA family protein [Myxococcaceae bacterium]MCA3011069.1 OmpA family protein [Myxococcaceae bacterium]